MSREAETPAVAPTADPDVDNLGVRELREHLGRFGVDGSRCVEKAELRALLRTALDEENSALAQLATPERQEEAAAELQRRREIIGEVPEPCRGQWHTHPKFFNTIASHFLDIHGHFRSALREMVGVANTLPGPLSNADRVQKMRQLSGLFSQFESHIHMHHSIEDAHVFPKLDRTHPEYAEYVTLLQQDHHHIDPLLDEVRDAIASLNGMATHRAVLKLDEHISLHLDQEEDLLVPLMLAGEQLL